VIVPTLLDSLGKLTSTRDVLLAVLCLCQLVLIYLLHNFQEKILQALEDNFSGKN